MAKREMVKPVKWILLAMGVGLAIWIAAAFFAPEMETRVNQPLRPIGDQPDVESRLYGVGQFSGADAFHDVSGQVALVAFGSNGTADVELQFTEYDATSGPDVYFFLATEPDAAYSESALKIPVPGGAGDGEATLRGNFSVPLPAGLDLSQFHGVVVWCEDFSVEFGRALFTQS